MTTITDNDLEEIKDLIKEQNQRISQLEQKFDDKLDKLTGKVDNLEKGQIRLETKLEGFDKRLDNIEFINRTIFGGLIVGLLLAIAKYLFPNLLL